MARYFPANPGSNLRRPARQGKAAGNPLWIAEDFNAAQAQISPAKPDSNWRRPAKEENHARDHRKIVSVIGITLQIHEFFAMLMKKEEE